MPGSDLVLRPPTDDDDLDSLMAGAIGWRGAALVVAALEQAPGSNHALACLNGEAVGYGYCTTAPLAEGGRANARIWVRPGARGRGAGTALWALVLAAARSAGLHGVHTVADQADAYSVAVAKAHGLVPLGIRLESRLDLGELDDRAVEQAIERLPAIGVELVGFDGSHDEEQWLALYRDLLPLFADAPDSRAGREPPPLDVIRRQFAEPWQVLLARRGEQTIGATLAVARADGPSRANTFFTGVVVAERGKGVATGLKAEHARRLRDDGWAELWTQNLSHNQPVLAANKHLGFQVVGGFQELACDF